MYAIRGVYDGKQIRVLPSESLPQVTHEAAVAIVFLEETGKNHLSRSRYEIARRMRAAREAMQPLNLSVKDLVEEGRDGSVCRD